MRTKSTSLTEREKNFCYNFIENHNAYQSALKVGYSESYAKTHIYALMKNPKVRNFLNELREERRRDFLISQEEILDRHMKIAFSNIWDFINEDGTVKSNVDGSLIKKITIKNNNDNKTVSIELEDRKESLKFLTEYMGLDEKLKLAKDKIKLEENKFLTLAKLKTLELVAKDIGIKKEDVQSFEEDMEKQLDEWTEEAWGDYSTTSDIKE